MPDFLQPNGSILLHSQTTPDETAAPTARFGVRRTDANTSPLADITMFGAGTSNLQGVIALSTMNSGTASGALVERMRIHTDGTVRIGTLASAVSLDVTGTVKATAFQGNGSALTGISDASRVSKAGDTMTGALQLPSLTVSGGATVTGNITMRKGVVHLGTTDGSAATAGEVVGGIGFWGFGPQHGQLSFRAGRGFELVDRSTDGPSLGYAEGSYPYADLRVRSLEAAGDATVTGNITMRKGVVHLGTTDGSAALGGEVVGGIGFWGFTKQHGQLSFRAGRGFELVDRSKDGPALGYAEGSYPYADLRVHSIEATGFVRATGLSQHHDGNSGANPNRWHMLVLGDNGKWDGSYNRLFLRREDGTYGNEIRVRYADSVLSSRAAKTCITPLPEERCSQLLQEIVDTQLVHYQLRHPVDGDAVVHLGIIAEDAPAEIASNDRQGLEIGDYCAFLMAGIKALKRELDALREEVAASRRNS